MVEEPPGAHPPGPASREGPEHAERPFGPHDYQRPYGPPYYRQPQPPRRGGLRFSYLVLAAAILFALAWLAAPFWAFRSMRSAALYGDTAALAELIDYGAVRASLRDQLGPEPAATQPPPPDFLRDPLGALRRRFDTAQPKPADVDAYLTPQALGRMSLGLDHSGVPPAKGGGPLPAVRFWDGERVRFGLKNPADRARETVLTFKRRGWFRWRLVAVTLPAKAPASP